jgi:hypothetical protein
MRNNLIMKWVILFFIFLLGPASCTGVSEPNSGIDRPGTSPTKVVADFLDALKKDDYGKAYEFVYAPFSDRDGYILQMKNLVKDHNISFLDYSILGSRILGDKAIVVAELEVELKPRNSNTEIHERRRNQYDLSIIEGRWRITSDKCILNCTNAGDLAGRIKQ